MVYIKPTGIWASLLIHVLFPLKIFYRSFNDEIIFKERYFEKIQWMNF